LRKRKKIQKMPWNVGLLGTGNLATLFAREIQKNGQYRLLVQGSTPEKTEAFCQIHRTEALEIPGPVDFFLVTVQNDRIDSVVAKLPQHIPIFICAGFHQSVCENVGYLYPLQSIHRACLPDIEQIPFLMDVPIAFRDLGRGFLESMGINIQIVTAEERRKCHMVAVLLNNFGYFLFKEGLQMTPPSLDPSLFTPLLQQTLTNALSNGDLQTGPARRNDQGMIQAQELLLGEHSPHLLPLYQLISEQIRKKYHEL